MRWVPLLLLCLTGCLGGSQNPSYFPYLLPTGDIVRTHAKPGGIGYFKNFDPKACKIEITTPVSVNPTKTQVVLIATVSDKDGDARRKRRVEWQIEGPGSIVEVDESGYLQGRGYAVTDKYAVSYSDYREHTITRGNDDPRDDFTICPGQTWCVVSSPVEGQTVITAHAPEVFDWEQRRAFARLTWTDGGFQPPFRSGRETDSSLNERAKAESPAGPSLALDARLNKAVAVNREATATIHLANSGRTGSAAATLRTTIPEGVDLVRTEPAPTRRSGSELFWTIDSVPSGQSRDVSLVFKPTRSGTIVLVASADTTDGLTASTRAESVAGSAGMTVRLDADKFYPAGDKADVKIVVNNSGSVPIENAIAWVTPGAGLSTGGTSPMEVIVGSVPPGQSKTVSAGLTTSGAGKSTVRVDVTADGGLSSRAESAIVVGRAELMVKLVGPESLPVGESATYEVHVSNPGDVQAQDVNVKATLPRGLVSDRTDWTAATLAPGERKVFRFTALGKDLNELNSISATASGTLTNGVKLTTAKTTAPLSISGQPVLELAVQGPTTAVARGSRLTYRITVRNRGTAAARDLTINLESSAEIALRKSSSTTASVSETRIAQPVKEIAPGASTAFTVEAEAMQIGDARVSVMVQSKDLPSPLKDEQATRIRK